MDKCTTVGDIIKALRKYKPKVPIVGFSINKSNKMTSITLLGTYGEIVEIKIK